MPGADISKSLSISIIYYADNKKNSIFATNFSYKIMSNLLIISSFNLKS